MQHPSAPIQCIFDSYVEDSSYYVDCKFVPPKVPPENYRQPCSIFCILDVSESMDQDAVLGGKDV